MLDDHCFWAGLHYYVDCNGDFWMPYEVPADCCCGHCEACRKCWCWPGSEATGSTGGTGMEIAGQ